MKSKRSGSKPIDLYSRLTLLILFGLFIIFTLVVIIIYSVGSADTSSWIGKIQQFLLNLYPNIFLIPFTFLFGYLFFGPIQRASQEAQEAQFLEKMKDDFLPLLCLRCTSFFAIMKPRLAFIFMDKIPASFHN